MDDIDHGKRVSAEITRASDDMLHHLSEQSRQVIVGVDFSSIEDRTVVAHYNPDLKITSIALPGSPIMDFHKRMMAYIAANAGISPQLLKSDFETGPSLYEHLVKKSEVHRKMRQRLQMIATGMIKHWSQDLLRQVYVKSTRPFKVVRSAKARKRKQRKTYKITLTLREVTWAFADSHAISHKTDVWATRTGRISSSRRPVAVEEIDRDQTT